MPPRPLPQRPVPVVPMAGLHSDRLEGRGSPFTAPMEAQSSARMMSYDGPQYSDYESSRQSAADLPLSSLSLHGDVVDDGAIYWPFDSSAGNVSAASSTQAIPPNGIAPLEASPAPIHDRASGPAENPAENEQITYQYALRYAMLLDADSALLAARTRSLGGVDALLDTAEGRSGSPGANGFAVKTVGRASGAPNLNNRTPTLITSNRMGAVSSTSPNEHSSSSGKHRGWKTSLLEFSDSAARRLKAEIGGSGKLKQLAKGKSSIGLAPKSPTKAGGMTPNIIKALQQQLKTSAGSSSVHPITKDCYLDMYGYLRVKEHSETLAEHGTIGDIMELFTDITRSVCHRHGITTNEAILCTVDSQADGFVKLFRLTLQTRAQASREAGLALLKLDDYQVSPFSAGRMRSNSELSSTKNSAQRSSLILDNAAADSKLISSWLKGAFNVPDSEHRQLVAELKNEVNQETATYDLRMCLLVLKKDQSFAGKPENFRTPHAYSIWKEREITSLEQLIHTYAMRQSYMSGEQIGAGRLKLEASAIESMGDEDIAAAFEYIPAKATQHYRALVHKAIKHDIVDRVATANSATPLQLSNRAKDLLKQLSIAWRVSASYRETCYLDIINEYYEQDVLPASYLLDAFSKVERIIHLMNPMEWLVSQYQYLVDVEGRIEYRALGCTQDVIEELDQQRPEKTEHLKRILRALVINDAAHPVVINKPMPTVHSRREEVVAVLEPSIVYRCDCLLRQCFGDESSVAPSLDGHAQLAVLILRDYERCLMMFSIPLLEDGDRRFDVAGIVAEIETEYFYTNLKRHIDQFGYIVESADIETTLELCKSISKIEKLHARYSVRPLTGVDNRRLFKETVATWLKGIDREKSKWAENALKQDSSPRELDIGKHSTSVIDLVSCFSQQAATVQRLEWPDMETKAWFLAEFMKYVDISFKVYATVMLKQFMACLSLPAEDEEAKSPGWNSMWNRRKYKEQSLSLNSSTQAAISKLDQSQTVEINAEACIKLNNLAIALEKLHELQDDLGVRETVEALGGDNRPSIKGPRPETFLLSFKVIRAESLEIFKEQYGAAVDAGARPYVKLAVTRQVDSEVTKRSTFGKTRPAPVGSANPRWNESFDLQVDSREEFLAPLEARVCTRDGPKRLGYREKTRARAFFAPPSELAFGVDGSVDVVLDLEPSGHLLLQVTMDGERDDVEFYSGRMFRFLERAMSDMQHRIVEQVSCGIREYLRQILVAQPARYRASRILGGGSSYMNMDRSIERSIQFLKRGGHQAPATIRVTQESCCEALIPLVDYLEDSLHIMFVHLYEDTANGVICKVWHEVLLTLEDILLPPLRGASKGSAKALTETDMQNIFDCLDFLKWYFEGGTDKDGIPEEVLVSRKYQELLMVREMYFMMSKELIDAYMHELRRSAIELSDTDSPTSTIVSPGQRRPLPSPPQEKGDMAFLPARLSPMLSPAPPRYSEAMAEITGPHSGKRPVPPPPIRTRVDSIDRLSGHRFGEHEDGGHNSSTDTLPMPATDIRTAIVPMPAKQPGVNRSRSVWAHKNAETLNRFKRKHRMVTDRGDLILRILRLRFDKEASKFVQTQLEVRNQQMHFEMRRAAKRPS
ncbi:hypothetical protein H4218_001702 [Coemansia sp. IMI 209128]|nr:hypothetical protein H4218_001702 [Coemansia sp. IMI 209128]